MVTDTGNNGYILANLSEGKAGKCEKICSGLMVIEREGEEVLYHFF